VLKDVIDEIADALGDKPVVVPSNPVGLDAHGEVVRGRVWGGRLVWWLRGRERVSGREGWNRSRDPVREAGPSETRLRSARPRQ
jgi:hypothetical protein